MLGKELLTRSGLILPLEIRVYVTAGNKLDTLSALHGYFMHKLSRYGSIKPENELIYAIGSEYYGGSKRTEVFVTLKDNGVFDGKYCDLISSGENASFQGALLKRNGVYSSVTVTSKERRYVLNGYYTIRIY